MTGPLRACLFVAGSGGPSRLLTKGKELMGRGISGPEAEAGVPLPLSEDQPGRSSGWEEVTMPVLARGPAPHQPLLLHVTL